MIRLFLLGLYICFPVGYWLAWWCDFDRLVKWVACESWRDNGRVVT